MLDYLNNKTRLVYLKSMLICAGAEDMLNTRTGQLAESMQGIGIDSRVEMTNVRYC